MKFKFRAECFNDVVRFHDEQFINFYKDGEKLFDKLNIEFHPDHPDVFVEFEANLTYTQVKNALKSIVDGHVMVRTLTYEQVKKSDPQLRKTENKMKSFTVNVQGNVVNEAKAEGYRAYYANDVTAIEIKTLTKKDAKHMAEIFGQVLYIFE